MTALTARARITAERSADGSLALPVLASAVPLVLRRTPGAVYLVGGAAGPLGGDDLRLDITVGPGAALRLRTAAAQIALPGRDPAAESVFRVSATIAPGAALEYLPEPLVVADRARHRTEFHVTMEEGAALIFREEIILGRHGEAGGTVTTVLHCTYAGRPLLRQSLTASGTDEVSLGPAVLAGHRAFGSVLRAGLPIAGSHDHAPGAGQVAVLPLAGPGVLITALAPDAVALRNHLAAHGRNGCDGAIHSG